MIFNLISQLYKMFYKIRVSGVDENDFAGGRHRGVGLFWTLDGPRVKSEIGRRKAEKQALSTYLDPSSDFRFPTSDFKWGTSKVQHPYTLTPSPAPTPAPAGAFPG